MSRARLTLAAAALTLGATLGATLAVVPAANTATSADVIRAGFRIKGDGTAGGYWIGSRSAGGQVVYRIDPGRTKIHTSGFGSRLWRSTLKGYGPHRVTTRDTARASWILAKYGTYRYDVQNAGVELALDHLLYGGSWSLSGTRTAKRLAALPERALIRSFATTMLADSARYAGPYKLTVYASSTEVGGRIPVTVRVRAISSGAGVPLLPVTITGPGGSRSVRTGDDGTARTTFTPSTAGPASVRVTVAKVPESRIQVRMPTTSGMSRIAVAGHKTSLSASTTTAVRARPTLTLRSTQDPLTTTGPATGEYTLAHGFPTTRTATAALYGPFDSAATASCQAEHRVGTRTLTVSGNRTAALPSTLTPPRPGYYVWGLMVPADTYNAAAAACGGGALAVATPTLRVSTGASQILTGTHTRPQVVVSGLPDGYRGTATLRLYGPAPERASISCTDGSRVHTQTLLVTGNGTYPGTDVRLDAPGHYGWSVALPGGPTSAPASSGCAPTGATVQVTRW